MAQRSPIACDPQSSRGRAFSEPESESRTCFQRDRDRVLHSTAFRRLKHKTQVFVYREGDHYRTRLTHSLEVAQITRSIARSLGLDGDLAEALALAHDLGHPPFGHAGEDELALCMKPYGGFDHNAQTLRVVSKLEQRYADFDGLNLCWETLEGLVKHNGPLIRAGQSSLEDLPAALQAYSGIENLELEQYPSAEAQIAALSDDIAYDNHDIDDGLRAELFTLDDLTELPLIGDLIAEVRGRYHDIELPRLIHETVRRLISKMIEDVVLQTRANAAGLSSADEVRTLGAPVAAFGDEIAAQEQVLKSFLRERMYLHPKVVRIMGQARRIIRDLFELYLDDPSAMPTSWAKQCEQVDTQQRARIVCDFIAGMTDRFAAEQHKRYFSLYLGA